jgi:hypothetical protein
MALAVISCRWCDRQFSPRQTGGHDQHFCRPACRRALHAEARRWVLAELAAGRMPLNAIKAGLPATCALGTDTVSSLSVPEVRPSSNAAPPELLKRFVIQVPSNLIRWLVFVGCQLRHDDQDDILAILTALTRAGRKPATSITSEGCIVLSY